MQGEAVPLEVSGVLRFDDIPVPYGFQILQEDSFTFENERARVGLLKYRGKSSPDQVVAFYREQMPLYNWEMLNVIEFGQRLLNFEKDEQTCIITVNPERSKMLVTIAISPKNAPSKLR